MDNLDIKKMADCKRLIKSEELELPESIDPRELQDSDINWGIGLI